MFSRTSSCLIAGTVFALLVSSHEVSLGESEAADRTEGLEAGHDTRLGV